MAHANDIYLLAEPIDIEEMDEESQIIIGDQAPTLIQYTIRTIHGLTKSVYERVMRVQENFDEIVALSSQWEKSPMYAREKSTMLISFGHKLEEVKNARYNEVRDASKKIQRLLKEDLLLFHNVSIAKCP